MLHSYTFYYRVRFQSPILDCSIIPDPGVGSLFWGVVFSWEVVVGFHLILKSILEAVWDLLLELWGPLGRLRREKSQREEKEKERKRRRMERKRSPKGAGGESGGGGRFARP